MDARRWFAAILGLGVVFRLAVAAMVGPGNDEAYYCLYADHLDWSYFDHPPLVGWVSAVGRGLVGAPRSILAHRLGFVAISGISTWMMYRLGRRLEGPLGGCLSALIYQSTLYYGVAVGTFVLPDGPLVLFWLLFLDRLLSAVEETGTTRAWLGVGIAAGGALLSKYHAFLLPIGTVALFGLFPNLRQGLRAPGPYLAACVAGGLAVPVLVWNVEHGWASLAFQGARALAKGLQPQSLLAAVGAQMIYLTPWIGVPLILIFVRKAREVVGGRDRLGRPDAILWVFSAVPLGVFSVVAATRPVFPHWGLIGFVPLIPLLGQRWAIGLRGKRGALRWGLVAMALGPPVVAALGVVQTRTGFLTRGWVETGSGRPRLADPTLDLRGWEQIAKVLTRRCQEEGSAPFIFTGQWYNSGQIAFALPPGSDVACFSTDARSFGLWRDPRSFQGRDGVLVSVDDRSAEPGCYEPYFRRIEPLCSFWVTRGGRPVRHVRLYRCVGQGKPFPFAQLPERGQDGGFWRAHSRVGVRRA